MSAPDPRHMRILGVVPNPPLGEEEEELASSFHTAGEFSRSAPRGVRPLREVRRDTRARSLGLIVSFLGATAMSVGFAFSFGWLFSIVPGLIGILSLALGVWVNLSSARLRRRAVRGSAV